MARRPARSSGRGSPRRLARARRAPRPRAGGARGSRRPAPRGCRGRCRPRCAGSRPATRVMSRKLPPLADERVVSVDAPRARLVDEQVRDHVGQVARQREQPVVGARVDGDRAPHRARRRTRAGRDSARVSVSAIGRQEPGRAVEQVDAPRAARPAPRGRRPGCPPTKRARSCRRHDATTALFVEPMSVTVAPGAAASTSAIAAGSSPIGRADARRDRRRRPPRAGRRARSSRSRARRAARARCGIRVVARDLGAGALARGETERASHQPEADDGESQRHWSTARGSCQPPRGTTRPRRRSSRTARSGSAVRRPTARARGSGASRRSGRRRLRRRRRSASGATSWRLPAACDGSTITGRCVSALSTGIAPMSSVKRVERSNVRMPRSHRMMRSFPSLATYSAAIRSSSTVADMPALEHHGLVDLADLGEQVEVLHVARADPDQVDVVVHGLEVARVHQLGRDRQARCPRAPARGCRAPRGRGPGRRTATSAACRLRRGAPRRRRPHMPARPAASARSSRPSTARPSP